MTRRTAYIGIAGVFLCVLVLWFTQNYAFVTKDVWTGMRGEARSNPLLAARMLLVRMGSKVEQSQDLDRLSAFPVSGTLFLADRSEVTPPLAHALIEWVRRGGHLVIAAEHAVAHDALLRELGVTVQYKRKEPPRPSAEEIELPDGGRVRALVPHNPTLYVERERIDWRYDSDHALLMLRLVEGRGRVTVMSSFAPFDNDEIGSYQHAELLWRFASREGVAGPVWLVRRLQTQSLPGWLADNALPALIALGILLLVALWHVIPRFGPLVPNVAPDRRSLNEHLAAMGRFYSSQQQLAALLEKLREDALDALAARAPETRGLDGTPRLKAAVRVSGLRPRELSHALTRPAATAREFTGAVRVLQEFRARLTRGVSGGGKRKA
jgi:hypothetical protein